MRKRTYVMILVLLMGIVTSCTPEKDPIRIGVNSWPPCEIWYVAQENGYFEDVPVEIVRFSSWTDNMSALYVGNLDITHSTYFNSVYFSDKGEEAFILAPIDHVVGGDGLVVKKVVGGIADLKGKKIGVEVGTDEHFLLYKALEQAGINIDDVEIVSLPSYSSHENFINGELDALFTYEPFLSKAAEEGDGEILYTTEDMPGYMVDVLLARKNDYKSRSEDYVIIMNAWYKALDYIQANHNDAYDLMARNEGMRIEAFGPFYESFEFYDAQTATSIMTESNVQDKLIEMFNFTQEKALTHSSEPLDKSIEKLMFNYLKVD